MKIQSSINFFHTDILEKFIDDDNVKQEKTFFLYFSYACGLYSTEIEMWSIWIYSNKSNRRDI